MPFSVEVILTERTLIVVSHVIAFTVNALERVGVWQTLCSFETRKIKFKVSLIAPH